MENLKLEASERKLNTKGDLKKLRLEQNKINLWQAHSI